MGPFISSINLPWKTRNLQLQAGKRRLSGARFAAFYCPAPPHRFSHRDVEVRPVRKLCLIFLTLLTTLTLAACGGGSAPNLRPPTETIPTHLIETDLLYSLAAQILEGDRLQFEVS